MKSAEQHTLNFSEMRILEKEFDQAYPAYRIDEKKGKDIVSLQVASMISIPAFPIMNLVYLLLRDFVELSKRGMLIWGIGMGILFTSFILGFGVKIVTDKKYKRYRKQILFHQKVFQRWLYEKKGINEFEALHSNAKEWEKKYFFELDVSKEKL